MSRISCREVLFCEFLRCGYIWRCVARSPPCAAGWVYGESVVCLTTSHTLCCVGPTTCTVHVCTFACTYMYWARKPSVCVVCLCCLFVLLGCEIKVKYFSKPQKGREFVFLSQGSDIFNREIFTKHIFLSRRGFVLCVVCS